MRVCVFKLSCSQRHYRSERYSFCFVLFPLPESEVFTASAISLDVGARRRTQEAFPHEIKPLIQSLVIISEEVLQKIPRVGSHRYGNVNIGVVVLTEGTKTPF